MSEATPRPWSAKTDRDSWGGPLPPVIKSGKNVMAIVQQEEPNLYDENGDRDQVAEGHRDCANALLIVRAVNLHEELTRALERVVQEAGYGGPQTEYVTCATMEMVHAALKKAKEPIQ